MRLDTLHLWFLRDPSHPRCVGDACGKEVLLANQLFESQQRVAAGACHNRVVDRRLS